MSINDDLPWFWGWFDKHISLFPGLDWGDRPEDLAEGWRKAFIRSHVTQNEAEAASYRVMEQKVYADSMLHALMTTIREARCKVVPAGPAPNSPAWCELCDGKGMAPLPPCDRHPNGSVCACGCAAGRAFHATCPTTPCLADRPDLRELIARDRAEREERGARLIAATGADPYGSVEEVARGLALIARRGIGRPVEAANGPQAFVSAAG